MRRLIWGVVLAALLARSARAGDAEDLDSTDPATRLKAARRLAGWQVKVDPALTPALVERMRDDDDPHVRAAAARALRNVQGPKKFALAALVEVTGDATERPGVRTAAIDTLGVIGTGSKRVADAVAAVADDPELTGPAVQVLFRLGSEDRAKGFLAHTNPKVREIALFEYQRSGGKDVIAFGLASEDLKLRRRAAGDLFNRDYARFPLKADEAALIAKYVTDPDQQVRVELTRALTNAKQTAHVIPALVEGLKSASEEIRGASARALTVAGPGVADHLPALVAAAEKTKPGALKGYLLLALGEAGEKAKPALPLLYAALKDKNDETRAGAAQALIKAAAADPAAAVKQVRPLVQDTYEYARDAATKVVTTWGTVDSTDVARTLRERDLMTALKGLPLVHKLGPAAKPLAPDLLALAARIPPPKPNVADTGEIRAIAGALAAIGPGVVPALAEALKSPTVRVRQTSAIALDLLRLDAVEAVPALRVAVGDDDRGVRFSCARALGNVGYRARTAVPDLIRALTKFDDPVPWIAGALCSIGATGDDAKKLIELAKAPAAPLVRGPRLHALGAAGADALPVIAEIEGGLDANSPLRGSLEEARTHANRAELVAAQLLVLRDKNAKAPHAAALTLLRYELNADQKKELVVALVEMLETRPAPIQAEALRCLGWLGSDAAGAGPAIEKLFASPDETVQRVAKQTAPRVRK